jgi:hypothetical protein
LGFLRENDFAKGWTVVEELVQWRCLHLLIVHDRAIRCWNRWRMVESELVAEFMEARNFAQFLLRADKERIPGNAKIRLPLRQQKVISNRFPVNN